MRCNVIFCKEESNGFHASAKKNCSCANWIFLAYLTPRTAQLGYLPVPVTAEVASLEPIDLM